MERSAYKLLCEFLPNGTAGGDTDLCEKRLPYWVRRVL